MNIYSYKNKPILHIIVGLGDGGAEATLNKIILNDKKYKHVVISLTNYGRYGISLEENGIPVYCLNFKKNSLNFIGIFNVLKIFFKIKPKLVQSWMYHADFVTTFIKFFSPNTNIIWCIRNSTYPFNDSKIRFIVSKFCSLMSFLVPKKIVSCGDVAKNDHIKFGYTKKNWQVIYNGVDVEKFKKKEIYKIDLEYKDILSLNTNNHPSIGMIARYDKQKGYEILLESLKDLKLKGIKYFCFLIGTNVNSDNIELLDMIKKRDLSSDIYLLGQRKDIDVIYNILDLVILSSINGEGFPNVLAEAMACETPCIATNVGETSKIIKNHGWLVNPKDINNLTINLEKAISLLSSPAWDQKRSSCRKHIVDNFTLEKMVQKYVELWDSL